MSGKAKGATKFWICENIKGWLAEEKNIKHIELKRRLKEHYKVNISYLLLVQLMGITGCTQLL
jgi:hypothetical protein